MIKVGICVSYDWKLLKNSLPRIYESADLICLSIDKNRKTWTGKTYEFNNDDFFKFIKSTDLKNKIIIYEDDFALPELSAMENDTRQRNLMSLKLGPGGWHLQIDSDEYFLNFKSFVEILKRMNPNPTGLEKALNVQVCYIPLIKKISDGYLYVDFKNSLPEMGPVATNIPHYERARSNGHFNIATSQYILHETWARSDDELYFKINNWGHSADELSEQHIRESYYTLWKSLDKYNFQYITNFHPAQPKAWPALAFVSSATIDELLNNNKLAHIHFPMSKAALMLRNNRNVARVKELLKKVFR